MSKGNIICSACGNDTFFVYSGFYEYFLTCSKCGSNETREEWKHSFNFYNDYKDMMKLW